MTHPLEAAEVIDATARPLAVRETYAPAEWTPSFAMSVDDKLAMLKERERFYREVMKKDIHYGVIPGTEKPTLYKPGAEALLSAMGLRSETGNESPPIIDVTGKDHNGEPFIMYDRYCKIYRQTGPTVNDRIELAKLGGACNSWEPKYRYRKAQRVCPTCGKEAIIKGKAEYGGGWVCFKKKDGCGAKFRSGDAAIESQEAGNVANENVLELQNTIKKMADKRALIAATLVATGCSDIFTQDIEDMPRTMGATPEPRNVTPPPAPSSSAPPEAHDRDADTEANRKHWRTQILIGCDNRGVTSAERQEIAEAFTGQYTLAEDPTKADPPNNSARLTAAQLHLLYKLLARMVGERNRQGDAWDFQSWLFEARAKHGGKA